MRIRQRDDRYRKKKKKQQQHGSTSHHHHQAKQLHPEPAYRRKPNPIRRFDTDVLSPVRNRDLIFCHLYFVFAVIRHLFSVWSCILYCRVGF